METVLSEIEESGLLEKEIMTEIRNVMQLVHDLSHSFHLDYMEYLTPEAIQRAKSALEKCSEGVIVREEVAYTIATLACAVKKTRPFFPHETQLVALATLILSGSLSVNRLLEVLTGEGKSCIIAMFSAALGLQGKHVDIITSSPVLACRDSEDWRKFYSQFQLNVGHNTEFNRELSMKNMDEDEVKKGYYEDTEIIYGTVSSFAADVLREEFQLKRIRCGRRFDCVIADEVDLLLLDEGVKFTYLSHDAAVLQHMEPVIASVWGVVGKYKPLSTTEGNVLYTKKPSVIFEAIFEGVGSVESDFEDLVEIVTLAHNASLISDHQLAMMQKGDPETFDTIDMDTAFDILHLVESYLDAQFEVHIVSQENLIMPVPSEEQKVCPKLKILLFNHGIACNLYNREEMSDKAVEKVRSGLSFSNRDEEKEKRNTLLLPQFFEGFTTNQLLIVLFSVCRWWKTGSMLSKMAGLSQLIIRTVVYWS